MSRETPFDRLLARAGDAKTEVVLIAPFVKESILERIIEVIASQVSLTLITRWRVDEVLAGVSDVGVIDAIGTRAEAGSPSAFRLLDAVHAKFYRFDGQILVGSANLTATGLGLIGNALELLLPVESTTELCEFESQAFVRSFVPSAEVVEAFRNLRPLPFWHEESPDFSGSSELFIPRFRNPLELFSAYSDTDYPSALRSAALDDVGRLGIPMGLAIHDFHLSVTAALNSSEVVRRLRPWCVEPRRFGEIRQWIRQQGSDEVDPGLAAQNLIRWVTALLPEEFTLKVPHYSEVLVRRV